MLLEYDGRAFAGWARQPDQRTVQAEVERALATILVEDEVPVTVAGRTDRGVHAWGQVCSYEHEAVDPLRLNAVLPPDVAVLECNPAADGFDARGDARSRTYCYRLLNRRARSARLEGTVHWNPRRLDRDALDACAAALPGTHDFTAFTPTETDHVRFERDGVRRALGARRRPARLLDHRGHLHAPHEPRPRRDDDRGRARAPHGRGLHRAAPGRAAVRRGRRPRRRRALRSRRSTTARERARCGRRRRRPAPGRARPPWRTRG